ncbi:MAG: hypothetical protein IJY79_06820 [Clostridia bacterium]|nr:hypothetical protein [Clostridia bacterium]
MIKFNLTSIKEGKQELNINNPKTVADYTTKLVDYINTAEVKAAMQLGMILSAVVDEIKHNENYTDYKNIGEFITAYNIPLSQSRVSQLIKGAEIYNYMTENNIDTFDSYTVTHYYEMRNIYKLCDNTDGSYLSEFVTNYLTGDESAKDIRKFAKEYLDSLEDSEDSEDSEENKCPVEINIKTLEHAESFYRTLISIINEGKSVNVRIMGYTF